ncbi:metalloprotease [Phellopilus nigrolimitatus]|nr:metalloprotease [Phellopilus nigrolimitatus]
MRGNLFALSMAATSLAHPIPINPALSAAASHCRTIVSKEGTESGESDIQAKRVELAARAERSPHYNSPRRTHDGKTRKPSRSTYPSLPSTIVLPVYWHVISQDSTASGGNIPDSQINAQIDTLNNDYKKTGLSFALMNTTRTVNTDWFNNVDLETPQQTKMKKQLRQGGADALNVYTVGFPPGIGRTTLGYSTLPAYYSLYPDDDGIVIHFSSVPGGTKTNHNFGRTLTHEAGHWVGLYHTFRGGCSDPGDLVDDTPPEASAAYGCPIGRDSCEGGGVDPIHNFMDYTDDSCMNEFTPGQIRRLKSQLAAHRGIDII